MEPLMVEAPAVPPRRSYQRVKTAALAGLALVAVACWHSDTAVPLTGAFSGVLSTSLALRTPATSVDAARTGTVDMALGTDRRSVLTAVLGGLAVSGAGPAHAASVLDPPALQKKDPKGKKKPEPKPEPKKPEPKAAAPKPTPKPAAPKPTPKPAAPAATKPTQKPTPKPKPAKSVLNPPKKADKKKAATKRNDKKKKGGGLGGLVLPAAVIGGGYVLLGDEEKGESPPAAPAESPAAPEEGAAESED